MAQQPQHIDERRPSASLERSSSRSSINAVSSPQSRRSPVINPLASSVNSLASINTGSTLTPRRDSSLGSSPSVSKRSSFAENLNLRGYPASPRNQRTHSFSGQALQDLLMSPTKFRNSSGEEARFKGRDWRSIQIAEIIDPEETRFVELSTSIEDCTKLLCRSGAPNVVLIRESPHTKTPVGTFDYSDLNAYLLLVLGLSQPDEEAAKIAERARHGEVLPLGDVLGHLGVREPPVSLAHTADLYQAMVALGSGNHRVVINKEGTTEVVGVLSQLRLVRFFWENHENFTAMEQLYSVSLKDLELGAKEVIAINGDRPVSAALQLMHNEGITSLPVLDVKRNVVGNISHVDVRVRTPNLVAQTHRMAY
jgi:CBS domain-containing protein